jgi:hypothetical protein
LINVTLVATLLFRKRKDEYLKNKNYELEKYKIKNIRDRYNSITEFKYVLNQDLT